MSTVEVIEWVVGSASFTIAVTALGLTLALPRRLRHHLPRLLPSAATRSRPRQRFDVVNPQARTVALPPDVLDAVQRISQRMADDR